MVNASDLLTTTYVTCDVNDRISSLLGKMKRAQEGAAVVTKKGNYLGIVHRSAFLVSRAHASDTKVANIYQRRSKAKSNFFVPTLSRTSSLPVMCKRMLQSNSRMLPVMEKDRLIGVVKDMELLKAIAPDFSSIPAFELASTDSITVRENNVIYAAMTAMKKHKIGHIPVVDKNGKLLGILSGYDYLEMHLHSRSRMHQSRKGTHSDYKNRGFDTGEKISLGDLPVRDFMSEKVITATPRTTIAQCIQLMIDNNAHSIVLTRYDKPVGVLTCHDIFIHAAQ
ncbi:CBS domain-containing protein [Candidatus Woesearchaeota archaeon]|nr:CBS domain-containing protein [Candidatus Woesearchaeota archaeon]